MPMTVVVEQDGNEKEPLLFPETFLWSPQPFRRVLVHVEVEKLRFDRGDYRLKGDPMGGVVERKAGPEEIAGNLLTKDRVRFDKAWDRFLECRVPILVMDCSLARFGELNLPRKCKIGAEDVSRAFWDLMLGPRGPKVIVWAGNTSTERVRRQTGEQILCLMMTARQLKGEGVCASSRVGG